MNVENFLKVLKDGGKLTLTVHKCADGVLFEIFKMPNFGQIAIRTVDPGETAGAHRHPLTSEWWLVFKGEGIVYLEFDSGIREMRHVCGKKPEVLMLPPNTGHNIRNVGDDVLAFFFFADRLYSADSHDKVDWQW